MSLRILAQFCERLGLAQGLAQKAQTWPTVWPREEANPLSNWKHRKKTKQTHGILVRLHWEVPGEVLQSAWGVLTTSWDNASTTALRSPWGSHSNCMGSLGKFLEKLFGKIWQRPWGILAKSWGLSWATALAESQREVLQSHWGALAKSWGHSWATDLGESRGEVLQSPWGALAKPWGALCGNCLGESWGKSCK